MWVRKKNTNGKELHLSSSTVFVVVTIAVVINLGFYNKFSSPSPLSPCLSLSLSVFVRILLLLLLLYIYFTLIVRSIYNTQTSCLPHISYNSFYHSARTHIYTYLCPHSKPFISPSCAYKYWPNATKKIWMFDDLFVLFAKHKETTTKTQTKNKITATNSVIV